jgi:protein phosphatase
METEILGYFRAALDREEFWSQFNSDWFCFDCEIMPWSLKAEELIAQQYAPTGVAARAVLPRVAAVLSTAAERGLPVDELLHNVRLRERATGDYVDAYRRYIAKVESPADIRVAPFHLLASEGRLHSEADHLWHIETLSRLVGSEGVLTSTSWRRVDLANDESVAAGIQWWRDLTEAGGEGMVVKPLNFISRGSRGLLQPALKCRGREYLRIIYGPEYSMDENLTRLKSRNVGAKRSLALREFALGMEGLERFVNREPLWRVHECVFGVLAMESEPVDPRL